MIDSFVLNLIYYLCNALEMLRLIVDALAFVELFFQVQEDLHLLIIICRIGIGYFQLNFVNLFAKY